MEKKSFGTLSLTRLTNDDFANLLQFTIDVAGSVKQVLGDVGRVALINLETSGLPYVSQTNHLRASELTVPINALRTQQISLMAEIKRIVTFEKKSRDEGRKTAAADVDQFFKAYWDIRKLVSWSQITHTTELLTKYDAEPSIMAKGTAIGIGVAMAELKTCNTALRTLYLQRNEETGGLVTGTDLRPAAYDAYVRFCTVIEQLVNLMPNDMIITLFNNMNELRAKAHALIATSKDKTEETC